MRRLMDAGPRWIGRALLLVTVVFLLAPAAVIAITSFSATSFIEFPPKEWGTRQYSTLASSSDWLAAIRTSFKIAIPTSLLCLAIAVPAVFAVHRTRMPGRNVLRLLSLSGLIVPISAYAVALYGIYSDLELLGTSSGLVLAHSLLGVPLVMLIASAAIVRIPVELELVAMSLGASRRRAWLGITLRLLVPALAASAILGFLMSFDEAVLVSFLGGPGLITLPKAIFDSVRFSVDAVITAIATLLMVATAMLVAIVGRLRRGGRAAS